MGERSIPHENESKKRWREWARRIDRSRASQAVVESLLRWPPLHGVVAAYLPLASEIALDQILVSDRITPVVPRVEDDGKMTMRLYDAAHLVRHRLGFDEPDASAEIVDPADVDVVLVPGLAFDHRGGRLGRGMGYYDRYLASTEKSTARVGVTTDDSVVDAVPMDAHDERLAWLATESGVHWVGGDLSSESERVMESAVAAGIAPNMERFPAGTRTSRDAARAVGCELGAIAKSLVFEVDGRPVLALCSGDRRIDEERLAAVFSGQRARPASRDQVLEITGFPAGGTPAFGHARELEVVADVSLARYRCVWTAGGTTDTVYPVSIDRLIAASRAQWQEIASRG